jgi:hypothetical protein
MNRKHYLPMVYSFTVLDSIGSNDVVYVLPKYNMVKIPTLITHQSGWKRAQSLIVLYPTVNSDLEEGNTTIWASIVNTPNLRTRYLIREGLRIVLSHHPYIEITLLGDQSMVIRSYQVTAWKRFIRKNDQVHWSLPNNRGSGSLVRCPYPTTSQGHYCGMTILLMNTS